MTISEATAYAKKNYDDIRAMATLVGGVFGRARYAADMLLGFEAGHHVLGAPVSEDDATKAAKVIAKFAASAK